ncbi:DUF4121 family protein [Dysgonomonas sp. GY75]|uniref:DUF4121 family protein n=1 Tax=Dysgonomonas sp. GY75 TaxID=2780419 RepID=UPI0018841320|nr:DUF4121 family protein [Dysgonomonas sp. GY75]MBF0649262.1 DUF4121 family protein [Dysgonomonas sp. GY75]
MLQKEEKRYSIGTLMPLNESYHGGHTLTKEDVDKVNDLVEWIKSTRSQSKPKAGDRLLYTCKHGDYSPIAFLERNKDGELYVCVKPMVPFAGCMDGEISFDVSGGPFCGMHEKELKYAGTVNNRFKTWGHNGMRANGAVYFHAKVSMWEYTEPEPLFGDFTTRTWRKIILNKMEDPQTEYLYSGNGIAFYSEDEYRNFLRRFCAAVFPGYNRNQLVVWCYRDEIKRLPLQRACYNPYNRGITHKSKGTGRP